MTVYVFANSPSLTIAINGFRRAALQGQYEHGEEAKQFVLMNFLVLIIGLTSFSIDTKVLKKTRLMLANPNILLHKIASNGPTVMKALPSEEHVKELKDLEPYSQRFLNLLREL